MTPQEAYRTLMDYLEPELERWQKSKFCLENSDNYCYTNGRMRALVDQLRKVQAAIAAAKLLAEAVVDG